MSDLRMLVIEDDEDSQEVVTRILKYHQIAHDVANDADEAFELMGSQSYDLIIIDLQLPRVTGWEILNEVRANGDTSNVPCVAITAFHSAEVAVEAIDAGFDAYFAKPIEATSFVRELERLVS
ncbi:MAG: response regulator [Chloroflexi bacterium]|nr:response regulator [Chloroflexota bacterium]